MTHKSLKIYPTRTDLSTPDRVFRGSLREAPPGFEPGVEDLQSSALPLGYGASTSVAQQAHFRAGNRARTGDLNLGKVALYQLSHVRVGVEISARGTRAGASSSPET